MTRPVADLAATVRTRIKHTVRMKKAEVPTWSEALEALDELAARATQADALDARLTAAQDECDILRIEKNQVEAEAARLREDNAVLCDLPSREVFRRAEAAEARCARLQQALAMLWKHYLLPITYTQKRQVKEALAGPTVSEAEPDTPTARSLGAAGAVNVEEQRKARAVADAAFGFGPDTPADSQEAKP